MRQLHLITIFLVICGFSFSLESHLLVYTYPPNEKKGFVTYSDLSVLC